MLITMTQDHEDSLNGGATRQLFRSGQTYDVPGSIGRAWCERKLATSAEPAARTAPRTAPRGKET